MSWDVVDVENSDSHPSNRSLHSAAQHKQSMYIFGGYDGNYRVNDFYEFHFPTKRWINLRPNEPGSAPSPRDRHTAVVYNNSLYVFGGFDGSSKKNDFHGYNFETKSWSSVPVAAGFPPSARHSHCAVVYENSMFIFGGYDSCYKNDLIEYNFVTETWSSVSCRGRVPRARYRATCVVHEDNMIMFGGHDGTR